MDVILEYILSNYTWILFGLIIILLAIIGWYADKTNFGQGKSLEQNNESKEPTIDELKKQLGNKKLLDEINEPIQSNNNIDLIQNNTQPPIKQETQTIDIQSEMNFDPMTGEPINRNIESEADADIQINNLESNSDIDLEKFEKQFNEIIPEKEIIDESLLEDIDDLTLDKTQKIDLNDIPDLDDLELPRIKKMRSNDEGIWKF